MKIIIDDENDVRFLSRMMENTTLLAEEDFHVYFNYTVEAFHEDFKENEEGSGKNYYVSSDYTYVVGKEKVKKETV